MKHLARILALVVPVVVVAASTIAVSPAAQNFTAGHPGLVAYIVLAAGVLSAVYKAIREEAAGETDPTPGPGSTSMAAK